MLMRCSVCGGTILPPAIGGAERGSCHCERGPGRLKARLYYGTASRPAWNEYDIEWGGVIIAVQPPTLSRALTVLNTYRTEWRAQHGVIEL